MKYKSNAFLWLLTGCGALALAWALLSEHHPKGFFVAVRVVVCFASTYAAVIAYRTKREIWVWLLGANAALYNPFVPVHLAREIWNFIGFADIALLIAAGILLRTKEESSSSAGGSSNGVFSKIPWGSATKEVKVKEFKTPSQTELWIWISILCLSYYGIYISQYYSTLEGTTHSETQSRNIRSPLMCPKSRWNGRGSLWQQINVATIPLLAAALYMLRPRMRK
jgi:hypothetical protein